MDSANRKDEDSAMIECSATDHIMFGWRKFRPKCLQFLNTPKWFLVVAMVYSFSAGLSMGGFPPLMLPMIEKRFSFTGKELGVIAAALDATSLFVGVFISYYGDYHNKIKWIGGGAAMAGVGVFLFSVPHFLIGPYTPPTVQSGATTICSLGNHTDDVDMPGCSGKGKMWYYLAIFVVAQSLSGIGLTTIYALIPPYIDENTEPKQMPVFVGLWYCSVFLGPSVGLFLAGVFLNIYVDIKQPPGHNLSPEDPRWIGAWWLSYLSFSFVFFLSAIIILGFPKTMPGANELREKHRREGNLKKTNQYEHGTLKQFLPQFKSLLRNWPFLFNSLAISALLLFQGAITPFYAKIIEMKFGLDPIKIGYYSAAVFAPTALIGVMLGSFLVKQFSLKTTCKKSALTLLISGVLALIFPFGFIIPGCQNASITGISTPYFQRLNNQTTMVTTVPNITLNAPCNLNCRCSLEGYHPVCGTDDLTYFSPCHAGCMTQLMDMQTFSNCSCVIPAAKNDSHGIAKQGYCDRGCKNVVFFMVLLGFDCIVQFIGIVPGQTVVLRCVPDNKRSFSVGMQFVLLKAIALIPGPIIFGHIVDTACKLWEKICGENGRCFHYDIDLLSVRILIFGCICFVLADIFFFLSWYLIKPETNNNALEAEDACLPKATLEIKVPLNEEENEPILKQETTM